MTPPLAYVDEHFIEGAEGRPLRILAEYLQPLAQLSAHGVTDTIVFFGSARIAEDGPLARYYGDARALAREVTTWARHVDPTGSRFVVCSGGGGGIMEAANRGACDAGGRTLGLNIGLPHEQRPNPFLSPELTFEFHYFFMRKLWFAHLARAVVVFPGGFGTLDELFEILTLRQTGKLARDICVLLYGMEYWDQVFDLRALERLGTIATADLGLVHRVNSVPEALACLRGHIMVGQEGHCPSFAHSVTTR